jgi:hypothetical protein
MFNKYGDARLIDFGFATECDPNGFGKNGNGSLGFFIAP